MPEQQSRNNRQLRHPSKLPVKKQSNRKRARDKADQHSLILGKVDTAFKASGENSIRRIAKGDNHKFEYHLNRNKNTGEIFIGTFYPVNPNKN